MNILFITPHPPYPPESGGKIRTYHLLRGVAQAHKVALFSLDEQGMDRQAVEENLGPMVTSLEVFPRKRPGWLRRKLWPELFVHFHSPALRARLREVLATPGIDLIHVDDFSLASVVPRTHVPCVLNRHKIDTLYYKSVYEHDGRIKKFRWQNDLVKLYRAERRARRRFHGHVMCSRVDLNRMIAIAGRAPARVVPNGVDLDYFQPAPSAAGERRTLVFVGTMDYPPNVDAARWFAAEIWPTLHAKAPDAEALFVGHRPAPEVLALGETPGITVTGGVDDVRPFVRDATAVVVPVRIGEGTRLKILEAMAMEKPVISTHTGAEGLLVKDGSHLFLARDEAEFITRTLSVLADPAGAAEMAAAGRRLVLERYGWEVIAAELLDFYAEVKSAHCS